MILLLLRNRVRKFEFSGNSGQQYHPLPVPLDDFNDFVGFL